MKEFIGELIGTFLLIYMGTGVVAGVLLKGTKSNSSGWLVVTLGWAFALLIAIYFAGALSGAHLNPAVTIALALIGKFESSKIWIYIFAQFLGAIAGAIATYVHYYPHWAATEDKDAKLAVFSTAPAIKNIVSNFSSEFLASFILMFGLMAIGSNQFALGLNPLIIALLIISIGLSLGGTTGWAINPARDLGPRIAHYLLPIPGKRDSNWTYAWIPVVAPIAGCISGAFFYQFIINL
ncbi:MAG: MIP/aquaporin family protein [Bacteroidota bacterium]|nr:MIP/aquaporin family protein [Bacteroidota bacterium]